MFSFSYREVTALAKCDRMNDFPVIEDACFAHRMKGSPGGKHCESLQRKKEMYGMELLPCLKEVSLDMECRILP